MDFSMEVVDYKTLEEEVKAQLKPEPEETIVMKQMANENVRNLMSLDMDSLEDRTAVLKEIEAFGLESIKKSSDKNHLLQASIKDLSKLGGESSEVAVGLTHLQQEMKALDPNLIDFNKVGFLGKFLNPVSAYFQKYQRADEVINEIITSLERGKNTLKNDNTTLGIEEMALRDLTKKLAKEIELGICMDRSISKDIEQAIAMSEEQDKINFIQEEVVFPLRQRIMDMQQMMLVNQQGIMAIEVIRRNNKELIRGVDRAKYVTVSALRIATMVAGALYNQKLVLKQIETLNQTTNEFISGTANLLKQQGTEIQKQSMETHISIETLKNAFIDTMGALESISSYKREALPKMKETIEQFHQLVHNGEREILKLERGPKPTQSHIS